ncbi:potassium/sodium hyperpolarization-activated cyclic nucleotide-gated channel 3-like [Emydura macquarii macquarii]|uniref:potassium/sodium hyperpolarization-activated cyclic nucleotide-gated channel 3-like n=1 Tax=Emydura macquarii macquarii TaxID=1129001 RepID=UPI00352BB5EC
MLSIGYGSANPPTGVAEVWVTITSAVSGYLLYMSVIANVATQLSHADPTANAYRDKMNDIQEYMSYRKLPQDLCQRIFTYYDIRYQGRWYNEEEILNEMSEPLKEEVKHHLCARLVKKVPLFQHCDLNFLNAVIMHLNIELFQPGEVIIVEGSYRDRMYFLEYGRVLMKSKSMTKELKAGDYFGGFFCLF